jgi:CDP-diacylglycerol--glycerol-3-phosphate 3-phosphatidyltransferase
MGFMARSGAVAILVHLAFVAATWLAYALVRPPRPARLAGYRGPIAILGGWAYWVTRPILAGAAALRFTANALTGIGLLLNCAAGVAAGLGAWGWTWIFLLWGSTADLLDGELARSTGSSSPAGAFLDSNLDRVSEIALLAGLAVGLPDRSGVFWAIAALASSLMVSYARARGEGLGVTCPAFGLERPHRMVAFLFAFLAATFLSAVGSSALLELTCAAVALGAGATALGRMVAIHQILRRATGPSREWHGTPPAGMP